MRIGSRMSKGRRIARVTTGTFSREVLGEMVLLQMNSGEYFGLDEIATRIWTLISEKGDLQEVEAALLEEFAVNPEQLAQDLSRLIDALVASHLIEIEVRSPRPGT